MTIEPARFDAAREEATRNVRRILANFSLFKGLDDTELDALAGASSPIRVPANSCVVEQGDAPKGMYLVVYGQMKVGFQRRDGGEKTLVILGRDKCFGLSEMLLGQDHQAFVKTTADTMLLHAERDTVLQLARSNFPFVHELMACVGRQLHTLVRDIESYALQTARQRIAGYLLRQQKNQNSDFIDLVGSKTMIASRLSLTPETFSRLLHDISSEGAIKVTGRRIRIADTDRLRGILLG